MDPDQTAPMSSLIWVHTVCHRRFNYFSRREKQTTFVAIGALRVKSQRLLRIISRIIYLIRQCSIVLKLRKRPPDS